MLNPVQNSGIITNSLAGVPSNVSNLETTKKFCLSFILKCICNGSIVSEWNQFQVSYPFFQCIGNSTPCDLTEQSSNEVQIGGGPPLSNGLNLANFDENRLENLKITPPPRRNAVGSRLPVNFYVPPHPIVIVAIPYGLLLTFLAAFSPASIPSTAPLGLLAAYLGTNFNFWMVLLSILAGSMHIGRLKNPVRFHGFFEKYFYSDGISQIFFEKYLIFGQ